MKADFFFVSSNTNIIIPKKMRQKKAHFVDDALKQGWGTCDPCEHLIWPTTEFCYPSLSTTSVQNEAP